MVRFSTACTGSRTNNDEPYPPYYCETCDGSGPCQTIRLLAEGYGIEVGE